MKPAPFQYHAPDTLQETVGLLAEFGDEAKVLAGGQSLIPMLALRLTSFGHLVDIRRVTESQGIEANNGTLSIGAGVRQSAVEANEHIASSVPLLSLATPLIGHFQIRNRGTLGGSIAHADPAAEYPAVALAMDAEMEVHSSTGSRTIPSGDFFMGLWSTALKADEVLVRVIFPTWPGRSGFGVEEFARRHGDFAIAGAAIGVQLDDDDRIARAAIALMGLGSTAERAIQVEREVMGSKAGDVASKELGRMTMAKLESIPSDIHGSADYRKRVGAAMVARAWSAAANGALNA